MKGGVRKPSKDVKNIFDEDEEEEVLEENEEDFVVYDDGEDFIEGERHAPTLFEEVFHDLEDKYVLAFEKIVRIFNSLLSIFSLTNLMN